MESKALNLIGPGLLSELRTECRLSEGFDPESGPTGLFLAFSGLWDTDATHTAISQKVVDTLNLKPIGKSLAIHAGGESQVDVYLISLMLPNSIVFSSLPVCCFSLTSTDFLIGMDVIRQGDFAITHHNAITKMTFCTPGYRDIDFVRELGNRL